MYTEKMSIEISNIPKEKFNKLRDIVIRAIFDNELTINEEETGYVEAGFSNNACGIDIVIQ